jgi:hypothetical protein
MVGANATAAPPASDPARLASTATVPIVVMLATVQHLPPKPVRIRA